jgi:hypothetical protein
MPCPHRVPKTEYKFSTLGTFSKTKVAVVLHFRNRYLVVVASLPLTYAYIY